MLSSLAWEDNFMVGFPSYLSTIEVAKLLRISTRTVCIWAECSELPAIKVGRQWRFHREQMTEWLKQIELRATEKATVASKSLG
jgi:excisionase family DNA binding protein